MEGTLIVTSAVRSIDPYLAIKDHDTRLTQLYCSMICWITRSSLKNIILCDNSCSESVFAGLKTLAEDNGKNLEILCFKGDHDRVVLCGKGFGEGEIIRHVLENSRLLKGEDSFFKVTGRVFVENFDEVMEAEKNRQPVFNLRMKGYKRAVWAVISKLPGAGLLCDNGYGYIQTIFYKCGIEYYNRHLMNCHKEVDGRREHYIENRMFLPLMKQGFSSFSIKPSYIGHCAGTGELYGKSDFSAEVKVQAEAMVAEVYREMRKASDDADQRPD